MAFKRLEALLLIAVFVNSASAGVITNEGRAVSYERTYDLMPAMPQFSSEAAWLNYTIPYPVPRPSPIHGQTSVLVIAVEFSDYNHTLSIDQVANRTINRLNAYYSHVSYGAVSVVGKVVGWVRLPNKLSEYGADNGPFIDCQNGDGYPDTWELLSDAAPIITNQVKIAEYEHVVVLHAGFGQESSGVPDDIWSVTFLHEEVKTPQGTLDTFSIVPEFEARGFDTLGVYTHEFGHLLGLPDLYSRTMEEVGPWDLMARGAWNGKPPGSSPAEMIAWDRTFLGWITSAQILNITRQSRVNATISAIELPSSQLKAVRVQTSPQDSLHYYLIEVRQKIGFDVALPSGGVLITYIDETASNPVKVIDATQTTSSLDDASFQVGQKYLDSENSIVVSIVSADGSSFTVTVDTLAPSPDILVENLTLTPPTIHPNGTASLNIRIANEGTLTANAFLVNVYLNETIFASQRISVNAGETEQMDLSWTPKKGGAYYFKVVLDPENQLSESNKGNNVKILRVVVGYTLTLEVRPPNAGGDLQWWLSVNGVNETHVGIGQFQIGVLPGTSTLKIQPIIYLNPSSRYVFRQWSDGSVSNPRTIVVLSDTSLSADFSSQFLLSLQPNGGVTSSGGWYNSGTPVTITANSPSNVVEKRSRLVFRNWSGDIQSNSTTVVITMSRPYNVTANWKTQYYLYIDSPYTASGQGWYDANAQATISLSSPITTGNGTRCVFVQWSGDVSGADPKQLIIMSGPKFVSAVWTTQYELKIESEYGHTSGAGWYAPNSQAKFTVDTLTIDTGNSTRRVFVKWSGDAESAGPEGTVVIDAPKVIRANWGTQYQLIFAARGVRNGTTLAIIVDSQRYQVKVPQTISLWHDAPSSVSFSTNTTVTEGFRRYILVGWTNSTGGAVKSPQNVLRPETYTVSYKELSMFPCIIATVTFGSEVTPEVQLLRSFRDHLVLSTQAGSAFMNVFNTWYYSFSPQVADFIASHEAARTSVRVGLYPLIGILELSSMTYSTLAFSPEFAIVTAGIFASSLIGLIYLTPISLFLVRLLSKKKIHGTALLKASSCACLVAVVMLALGELTGSLGLLAVATSALVLTTLVSTPLLFSSMLMRNRDRFDLPTTVRHALSRSTAA